MFSLPIRLVIAVALAFILSSSLNISTVIYFYSVSVLLKDILMVILPFVVFSYLSSAILSLQKQALALILGVFLLVIIANLINVFVAYGTAQVMLGFVKPIFLDGSCNKSGIEALWRIPLPSFFVSDKAMITGLIIGITGSFFGSTAINSFVQTIKYCSTKALNFAFIPFLPVYVFGFVLKIGFEGELSKLVTAYAPVFFLSFITIQVYLLFWYWVGCGCNLRMAFVAIRNIFPAWLTGFSTMSSAATLPITLQCIEKNIPNKNMVNFVVPATANIHMAGDGINITLTAIALLAMSSAPIPDISAFIIYACAYVFTKFSGSGVPGGGMIILLPVVEKYLGLSVELSSLVATLYILQDSLMTASNVAGNGALALIANKIFARKFAS